MSSTDMLGLGFPLAGLVMAGLLYRWFLRLPDAPPPDGGRGPGGPRHPVEPCTWPAAGPSPKGRRRSATRRRPSRTPVRR